MKRILIELAILAIAIIALILSGRKISDLKEENDRISSNQELLLSQRDSFLSVCDKYKVSDSLNAVEAKELRLTIEEYERHKKRDMALIKRLKSAKSDISSVVTHELETTNKLSIPLNDTLRRNFDCFTHESEFFSISGCVYNDKDSVDVMVCNREKLKVVESVTYRRFLGFLWKTKRVKSRQIDVLSLNPNTEITGCEYVTIVNE